MSSERLIRAARPVLDRMSERLGDLTCVFVLADPEARILDRLVCQPALTRRLDSMSVAEGFVFAEDAVGTNGMGTVVELRRMTRIDGHEHYAETYRTFTCVGVPIIDRVGREMVGVLDVACPADPDNEYIDLLAEQTARSIEDRLLEERSQLERALLDEFLAARRGSSGVVVVSDRMLMTDPQAARVLNGVEQPLVWERASRALGRNGLVHEEFCTPDGGIVTSLMRVLHLGGDEIGVLMQVQALPGQGPGPAPRPVRPEPVQPDSLVGLNNAFLDAYRRCCAADSRVLVSGEPGTGKLSVLRAAHEQTGAGPFLVHDLAECVPGEEVARLTAAREVLHGDPGMLVMTHANVLPPDAPLSAMVDAATRAGWRVGVTYTSRAQTDGSVLPDLDAYRVGVPPLRNRLEDLPALTARFAGQHRIAPEAVQLLMRLSWPGNLRELRTVVDRMVAASSKAVVGLDDVAPELRQAAPRRQLTRFERAEVHAILEAMADCGGNKREAAKLLGISRSTLYRKLQAAGIDLDNTVW